MSQYVVRNDPIGETHLEMSEENFRVNTAQLFSTYAELDFESACYWFEAACKGGAVYG